MYFLYIEVHSVVATIGIQTKQLNGSLRSQRVASFGC